MTSGLRNFLAQLFSGSEQDRKRINFDWVTIPDGDFLMGSSRAKGPENSAEHPQHRVYLPDYCISRVPVTNAQYKQYVDSTWKGTPSHWKGGHIPSGLEQHPVVNVNWHDATKFCKWAGVRLPTEAEWEKAASWKAKPGTKYIYPWGNEYDRTRCNARTRGTTAVGSYPQGASPYGVLDMTGNVWEWTADWIDANYYANSPTYDPKGPEEGTYRALRGGAWDTGGSDLQCTYRTGTYPRQSNNAIGFRVAISISIMDSLK